MSLTCSRRATALIVAAALVGVPVSAEAGGNTIDTPGVTRWSGADRYGTATAISRAVFPTSTSVFLASGSTFPDALAAGPAAAKVDSPVLLTTKTSVATKTQTELNRLAPTTVYILGGTAAVSNTVAATADDSGAKVVRLAGPDRYETSVAVSQEFWQNADTVYLATGAGYADALSGGALAAKNGAPVLLSDTNHLPAGVGAELARLSPSDVVLLGGTGALSNAVADDVGKAVAGVSVSRLAGADRYATSEAIATSGWSTSQRAFYDNGLDFPDALAGTPAAAANDAPLLLTKKACMPASTAAFTKSRAISIKVLLGGSGVLDEDGATVECGPTTGVVLTTAIGKLATASESNSGYDRSLFGRWIDADGDCQDTRDEVLQAESQVAVSGCNITTGRWFSYYDHQTWTQASDVDIDHMVPLAEAFGSGARNWSSDTRQRYANDLEDPRALVAVTDNVNQSKSDRDPAQWLPQYEKCRYVSEWTAIKLRWKLTADSAEKNALLDVARSCPGAAVSWQTATITGGPPPPTPTPTPTTPGLPREQDLLPPPPPDLDCSEIPYTNFLVRPGDPHRFDADGDGIGCES